MLHEGKIKDIARMDRVIKIYNRVAEDTDLAYRETDVLVSTEWAEEMPQTRMMREDVAGGKESSIQEVRFRIRKSAKITTMHNVLYDEEWYDIITILPGGRDYTVLVTQLRPNAQWQ